MTTTLTQAEIDALPTPLKELYLKQLQINALSETLIHLSMRFIPGTPDAADVEDAISDLQIELGILRARFQEMAKAPASITPVTAEDVAALKQAIEDLSAVVAANAAAGALLANAKILVGKLA